MSKYPRPKLLVSTCLGFKAVRYNGQVIPNKLVALLKKHMDIQTVCPEVGIGLGVPREPIRIVNDSGKLTLYQPATKKKLTRKMNSFSKDFSATLTTNPVDGAILKSGSPTCGTSNVRVYQSYEKHPNVTKGRGLFAAKIMDDHPHLAIEDEGRLNNFMIRENWLAKIYTMARYRELDKTKISALVKFQEHHKYLFMQHNEAALRRMGRLVANQQKDTLENIHKQYAQVLNQVFSKPATPKRTVNVFEHMYGYVKNKISKDERTYFFNLIDEFIDGRIPRSTLSSVLYSWILRFDVDYLKGQVLFDLYPKELILITDSGKGRNI